MLYKLNDVNDPFSVIFFHEEGEPMIVSPLALSLDVLEETPLLSEVHSANETFKGFLLCVRLVVLGTIPLFVELPFASWIRATEDFVFSACARVSELLYLVHSSLIFL
jgi:hypothetical protein